MGAGGTRGPVGPGGAGCLTAPEPRSRWVRSGGAPRRRRREAEGGTAEWVVRAQLANLAGAFRSGNSCEILLLAR